MKIKPGRHTAAFVLLFLTLKPSYGFELLKEFETNLPNNKIDSAAIYRALKTLETNGSVESRWDTSEAGAAKKYYSITENGYKELEMFKKDIELRYENLGFFLKNYKNINDKK
ncbi:PadR family transcriptional regulator [Anaerovorax odorimutans]|uniref:PadR family transcriptional regulator n=1 Tax=Anaerovorax odorimutans TaxID=109327 RepID=UPI0004257DAA|nr:PadR family transcriptional regulator [Anaerovorax odorimutans]